MKHNKKRNTAFLFETLVGELTKAVVSKNEPKRRRTLDIIRKHFVKGSALYEDLQLYKALNETSGLTPIVAEKMLFEVKAQRKYILDADVFEQQTDLIKDMNVEYTKNVFSNFVPNYKSLATISQIFSADIPVKERVLLESGLIDDMTAGEQEAKEEMQPIDNLVYKTFVSKFNEKYTDSLNESQRNLLTRYISSFSDGGLELKMYVNEEVERLRSVLKGSMDSSEIGKDQHMLESAKSVMKKMDNFSKRPIDEKMLKDILKIQELARELTS
tara:strand:- start:6174 stop:6989 length:816 start_codon:yes stop_codon:yes gene_type:complete